VRAYRSAVRGGGMDDTNEKCAIGRLWEQNSDGRGLFVIVERQLGDLDMRGQLLNKIGG
jgi:type III restriction enzyme